MENREFRYCILYTNSPDQHKLKNMLEKYLPPENGLVFCPCVEFWRRDKKKAVPTTLFPGYVFLYTDFDLRKIHELLREHRAEISSAIRELGFRQRQISYPNEEDDGYEVSDVNAAETEFLDFLREGNGLLAMSAGYEDNNKFYVMEGPLKAFESHIVKVDKHNKKAFLDIKVKEYVARAGFECKPKSHWFPEIDTKIATLSDGTEVDLKEFANKMMGI